MSSAETRHVVLVTGAAGKTGRAVLRALRGGGLAVRAFVREPRQRDAVARLGVDEVFAGDLLDEGDVREAARGARGVYHICPNVHPAETAIGSGVIAAARAAGVERFVFHSVLHPQTEAMPHHWAKLRVEEALLASGLPFTILQPAPYMQNVFAPWERIVREGVYPVPYALSTRLVMVDLEDVAAAAARVLTDPRHAGATYELCAPELLDQTEIADALGRHLGRAVRAEAVPVDAWARGAGLAPGSYPRETLAAMFRYYERYGMAGGSGVLEWLLGRPPARFSQCLARRSSPRVLP
ncbi:MAG: NmrA/HSCARG family protein [Acidobacteriota bacterium]|nr:NmrA/HSCARG family protein [Acidobacteriota bacterium]MDH3524518.1 NmrA/HSCARG family protein [Acidobacteriota bacterium]